MKPIDENSWPAREPTPSFADATVDRLLAGSAVSTATAPRRHHLAWLLVAAVLISGAALGVALGSGGRKISQVEPIVPKVSVQPETKKAPVSQGPTLQAEAPQTLETVVSKPRTKRKPVAMPKATASAVAPSAPKVPACGCERGFGDYMCDCY